LNRKIMTSPKNSNWILPSIYQCKESIPANIPNAHNYKARLASYYHGARLPTRFQRSHVPS
jgi:hypothetical protein